MIQAGMEIRIDGFDHFAPMRVTADSPERGVEMYLRSYPHAAGRFIATVKMDDGTIVPVTVRKTIEVGTVDADAMLSLSAVIDRSRVSHPAGMRSAHEGLGVLMEEFDELKAEIYRKEAERDMEAMASEALDVACAAIRFVEEVCCSVGREDAAGTRAKVAELLRGAGLAE